METDDRTTKLAPACEEIADLLAAADLATALPAHELARVRAHLARCADCRSRPGQYSVVADALLMQAPLVTPPAGLRDRIVAQAQQRRTVAQAQPPAPVRRWPWLSWRPTLAWRHALVPSFGLLAAMLLGLSLGMYAQLRQQTALAGRQGTQLDQQQAQLDQQQAQLDQQREQAARNRTVAIAAFGNDDAQERRLAPVAAAPEAEGRVLLSPGAPALALYVKQLPPLGPDRQYHIWWEHNGQPLHIGSFSVDAEGRAWSLIQPAAPLAMPGRIYITAAPSGTGAPPVEPTGPVYLRAEF